MVRVSVCASAMAWYSRLNSHLLVYLRYSSSCFLVPPNDPKHIDLQVRVGVCVCVCVCVFVCSCVCVFLCVCVCVFVCFVRVCV